MVFGLIGALAPLASTASAADYFIYKDSAGRTVLSNQKPSAGATAIRRFELPDATDAEIAATRRENAATARLNALRDLADSNRQFAREMQMAREQGAPQVHVEVNSVDAASATALVPSRRPQGGHHGRR